MAQGQDRIAQTLLELEPTAIVEFFQLYFNTIDKPDSFIAFHGGSLFQKGIKWQGVEYLPIPVETEGFEVNANGQLARPKLRVSNKDYFVTDLLLQNDDLQFAKLIRKRTFVKYLDDANFDGGNPWGLADASAEISTDTYVIGQKTNENKVFVEFELTSPLDLENFEVNNRLIMSKYCSWYYRGNGCNYRGLPLATEDGRMLTVDNEQFKIAQQWQTGVFYQSGHSTYLENTKITVADPQNPAITSPAKIWYVCQQNHTGSLTTKPDINQTFWAKDGCNKKLDGCKMRFGKGVVKFNDTTITVNEPLIDFTSRSGSLRYNNIAPNANITVISGNLGFAPNVVANITDLRTGSSAPLWQTAVRRDQLIFSLEWSSPKRLTGLAIFDSVTDNNNIRNVSIRCFDQNNSQVFSGRLQEIPLNGATASTGLNPSLNIKKIEISGYNIAGVPNSTNVELAEVAIYEANSPYMFYRDTLPTPIHRQDYFHIATKVELANRSLAPNDLYSIYHNIGAGTGTRYSGINLYLSGNNLNLDFAIRRTGQGSTVAPILTGISLPWDNDQYKPIHLICSGGNATGVTPTSATPGFIRLEYGTGDAKRQVELTLNNQSGQYFMFKNSSYQNGIGSSSDRLEFGLNDWQFPQSGVLGSFPVSPIVGFPASGVKVHSPIRFGPTAIWTGRFSETDRINFYNQSPMYYDKVSGVASLTTGLYAWWDMNMNDVNGEIAAENNATIKLFVTGTNFSAFDSIKELTETVSQSVGIQKQSEELPFGGFPGTEKYG